jgi:Zn-dependent M28 family amino/carboxypeptidase
MVALDTLGYFSSEPGSQRWPEPYDRDPRQAGDFISFVSNDPSAALMQRCVRAFRGSSALPARGSSAPEHIRGVSWSDHWSFWRHGFPAVMVTDTALFRYPHYHSAHDTPDKIDFASLELVVDGLVGVVREIAGSPPG